MPQFSYKVRDKQGRVVQATQDAASKEELIAKLQKQDLLLVSEVREEIKETAASRAAHLHVGVSLDDLIMFSRQLATMLEAGVTLLRSLDVLSKQIESKRLLNAVEQIKKDIGAGSTFRDALVKHPQIFSQFWVHIVETGEASGALPVVLAQLADYLETSSAMRQKVMSALIYPLVLVGLSVVCLAVFVLKIIPIFARMFDSFAVPLPALTKAVMAFSDLTRKLFLPFIAGSVVGGYMLRKYIHTEKGKLLYDKLLLKVPILSRLFRLIAIERFASGLGTLIESGVPILYGLDIVGSAVGNKVIAEAIGEVRESVRQGKGMARPLDKSGVFTPMVVQMVAVGEEIGELGKMLERISQFYKERISITLGRIATLIEPLVLVFMGIVVGVMVVSMFMPIFQMATISGGF